MTEQLKISICSAKTKFTKTGYRLSINTPLKKVKEPTATM